MNKGQYIGWIVGVIMMSFLLSGCGKNGVTYKYVNQDKSAGIVINKSVYLEDELKLYVKADDNNLEGDFNITFYDSEFNAIDEEFTSEYRHGVLSIKGKNINKISGLYIDGRIRYHLRYLDSNEYAILYEHDVTEIGWETYGDTDKYYTSEELAKQQAAVDEARAIQEENFRTLEGTWKCDRDPSLYIRFYEEDGQRLLEWNREIDEGEYYLDSMGIAVINICDSYLGKQIEICDDPYWGMMMRFYASDDLTQIIDGYSDEDVYFKE